MVQRSANRPPSNRTHPPDPITRSVRRAAPVRGEKQPGDLGTPISLAASFNLACWRSPVPGRPASPGHALPPPISLATSFNLVCLLVSLFLRVSFQPLLSLPSPCSGALRFCWRRPHLPVGGGRKASHPEVCRE